MKKQLQISLVETAPVNIATVRETIAIKDFTDIMQKLFSALPCEDSVAIIIAPIITPRQQSWGWIPHKRQKR